MANMNNNFFALKLFFLVSITLPVNAIASDFSQSLQSFTQSFDIKRSQGVFGDMDMRARAKRNATFCAVEKWNTLRHGQYNEVSPSVFIELEGENLRDYKANTTPVILKLYRLLAEDLVRENSLSAKYFLDYLVDSKAFTKIKPHKFTRLVGQEMSVDLKNFSPVDEQIAKSAMVLLSAAITVEAHKTSFSDKNLEKLAKWGETIFDNHSSLESDALDLTYYGKVDVRSQIALGYIAFGIAAKHQNMFDKGVTLFQHVIEGEIQKDGGLPFFLKNHAGNELDYHNQTTGYLTTSASILKANGFDMYDLQNANGGTLRNAIQFVVSNAFESKSPALGVSQLRSMVQITRNPFVTMAWLELALNDNEDWLGEKNFKKAFEIRNVSASWVTENKAGFNGANFGGYTSCYFSSIPPKLALIDEVEMFNFYQNTSFEQRSCLFKNINPDLLVLFKANQKLPTEKLEERRKTEYVRCKDK
jgi:hypothetical protein